MTGAALTPADVARLLDRAGYLPSDLTSDDRLLHALRVVAMNRDIRLGRLEAASRDLPAIRAAMADALDALPAPPPRLCPACRAVTIH